MTTKKDIFNITYCDANVIKNIDNQLEAYYARQKQEYLRKWGLKELKQGKTRTALQETNY